MSKKKERTKFVLPNILEELEALLAEERKKLQNLNLEKMLGKLKKMSEVVETKRRIANTRISAANGSNPATPFLRQVPE